MLDKRNVLVYTPTMQINAIKTKKIIPGDTILEILDTHISSLQEYSIVVVTSKIMSICQNNVVPLEQYQDKKTLIRKEADWYYEDEKLNKYGVVILTLKDNILIANAGIDESNANGMYVLWPKDIQQTTNAIWHHLREKHTVKNVGVIITDSRLTPLRYGTLGVMLSYCGFKPLKNYIETPDIFDRNLKMTKLGVGDALAAASVGVMGEGAEQTPLATITDIPFVEFVDHVPMQEELNELKIDIHDDIYAPLLEKVEWKKGGRI